MLGYELNNWGLRLACRMSPWRVSAQNPLPDADLGNSISGKNATGDSRRRVANAASRQSCGRPQKS
jgi:hypothetical protein